MTKPRAKADGYRLLLSSAEREVEEARIAVSQHRHGAAHRLREAERFRDAVLRKIDAPVPVAAPAPSTFDLDTLAPDFGVDDDEAPR